MSTPTVSMFSGSMIETITCQFKSRVECQDWHDKISGHIRSSRQSAVLPNKLSVQPVPPPHVSYPNTPPYSALTAWIRDKMASRQLSYKHIKSLQKPSHRVFSSTGLNRSHKVECLIYPSHDNIDSIISISELDKDDEDKSPVILKDPHPSSSDSNPFGYIHYIPTGSEDSEHCDNDKLVEESEDLLTLVLPTQSNEACEAVDEDMNYLLPRSLLNSSQDSSRSISRNDTVLSQLGVSDETDESHPDHHHHDLGPWGKRLPKQFSDAAEKKEKDSQRSRVVSEGCCQRENQSRHMNQARSAPVLNKHQIAKVRQIKQQNSAFRREESPPEWISCFPSSKSKGKSDDYYSKAPRKKSHEDSPIKFIDKTPSANSLNLPYCPPVKVDFENFSKLENLTNTNNNSLTEVTTVNKNRNSERKRSTSQSKTRTSELAVIPVDDPSELYSAPCTPLSMSTPASPAPERRQVSQVVAQIGVCGVERSVASRLVTRCGCDSRRSSDSGLADMTVHADKCPLGQSQQSVVTTAPVSRPQHPLSPVLPRRGLVSATSASCLTPANTFVSVDSNLNVEPQRDPSRNDISVHHQPSKSVSLDNVHMTKVCGDGENAPIEENNNLINNNSRSANNVRESGAAITDPGISKWSKTKEIYKTGLYAHWWLNASLQPITEECNNDKLSENL